MFNRSTTKEQTFPYSMLFSHGIRLAAISEPPAVTWNLLSYAPSVILHHCASAESLEQAKQAHAIATIQGLLHHGPLICAALILTYATFKHTAASQLLFNENSTKHRNVFLWNTLIRAYNNVAAHEKAFAVYNQIMKMGIVRPDDHTFPFVLKTCADFSAVNKGREIHGSVLKLGFERDVFVGNTLLTFYSSTMFLFDAQRVFNEMGERDAVSWNSIIAAFLENGCLVKARDRFLEMNLASDLKPNSVSVVSVLPACAGLGDEVTVRRIHGYAVKAGLDSELTVCNAFVDAYGKCGKLEASMRVFDEMVFRNEVSWNTIIGTLAHLRCFKYAVDMFREMLVAKLKLNSITISSLLPALVELESFKAGKEIHGFSIRTNLESDVFVSNSLIDMYAKAGCVREASNVFNAMETRNVVSWNTMVANFAQNGFELDAIRLVNEMQFHGESPNSITFTNVLPACARIASLRPGKEIHARSIRIQSCFDLFVSNALTDMYAKCGRLSLARNVFGISERDEVSYNTLIVGYSQSQDFSQALLLFSQMGLAGLKYDTVSFMGVLSACANLAALKQGKEIHGLSVRKLFHLHLFVANSLLDLYTKCGQLDLARQIFDAMLDKDVASWNTMILAYGMQGELEAAINLFDMMIHEGVEYDYVSYIAVLSACSHGGLVERGKKYFNQMCCQNIKPTQMHYACMVDLLGRSGLMEEAADFIRNLPVEPDSNVWGALLGACRVHGNIELGRWAGEHLFELKPKHCGYYILLSNMYAEAGRWDEANSIRDLMKSKGARKNPGCSWVELDDYMHAFIVEEEELKELEAGSSVSGSG